MPHLSEEEKRVVIAIMRYVGGFRPDWARKMQYFLEEQGWEINYTVCFRSGIGWEERVGRRGGTHGASPQS